MISVALIGYVVSHIVLLFIIIFIAGFAIVGGQPAINALSAVITQFHFVLQEWAGVSELPVWVRSLDRYLVLPFPISDHYPFIRDCCNTFATRHYYADYSS